MLAIFKSQAAAKNFILHLTEDSFFFLIYKYSQQDTFIFESSSKLHIP